MEEFANPNLSVVVEKCWFSELVERDRTCMCSVFTTTQTDIDDQIVDCLITSMAPVQATVGFYNHELSWCVALDVQLCTVAISRLSAQSMQVVEY